MNTFALDPSLNEVASSLTPTAVSQYMAARAWELESRQDHVREIWRLNADNGTTRARIMLPLATDYADFHERFYDALYALSRVYDWDAEELQERITSTRADLFFIRLDQRMTDGTIPLRQAEATLDAIYKMLKAAATTAADPRHSHRGRRPSSVTDFLEEDVRLGHTKRGSFVFTVVSRLGEPGPTSMASGLSASHPTTPFPRRVMETLARGLETTRDLTRGHDTGALEDPARWGLSAGLIEALEEMAQPDDLRSLDLSFEWSAAEARPDVGNEAIILEHQVIGELARVRERLIRQEEPMRRETLVGAVRSLTREEGGAATEELGTIVVYADVNGKYRNVQITLNGQDHEWAIIAYRERLPFTVTGDLVYERRAWRLVGDIEVDSGFLQYRVGDDSGVVLAPSKDQAPRLD